MTEFNFEKLEVYQKALRFVDNCFNICDALDYKLQSSVGDQLRRSSLSIANNIAEGSDKRSAKDKKKFYAYSLDSARECIPVFTVLGMRKIISAEQEGKLRENCAIICKMLNEAHPGLSPGFLSGILQILLSSPA